MNLILSTAIVDLYSKCGALKEATFVFDRMKDRNVITWTAVCYACRISTKWAC